MGYNVVSKADLEAEILRLRSNLDAANLLIDWQREYIQYCEQSIAQGATPIAYISWLDKKVANL